MRWDNQPHLLDREADAFFFNKSLQRPRRIRRMKIRVLLSLMSTLIAATAFAAELHGKVTTTAAPHVLTFTATPSTINHGESSTLAWTTQDATEVLIEPWNGSGFLPPNGSIVVSPGLSQKYTLSALSSSGTAQREIWVYVIPPPPTATFTATPAEIQRGDSATLSWNVQNAGTVKIEPGVGTVLPIDTRNVTPTETTTYTLTASGNGGSITRTLTVTVIQPPEPPLILSFAASPREIAEGASATLSWHTANASAVFVSGGVGNQPPTGSVSVTPSVSTMYRLTAFGAGGIAEGDTGVTVHAPPVITFSASPDRIVAGQAATLTWVVTGAATVELDHGIGIRAPSGQIEVKPLTTTTYLLTARGPGGMRMAQAAVSVAIPRRRAVRH